MKSSLRSLSKPVHALPSCTNSIKHAFPSLLQLDPSPYTQHFIHTQADRQPTPLSPPNAQTDAYTPWGSHTQTKPLSHPTNGAVFSVPAWAAFTLAVLASAMLVAARVTRPLVTPGAHPAFVTTAGARHTNAMATTVGCTNLCGRQQT